jgi:hypothetical protein
LPVASGLFTALNTRICDDQGRPGEEGPDSELDKECLMEGPVEPQQKGFNAADRTSYVVLLS